MTNLLAFANAKAFYLRDILSVMTIHLATDHAGYLHKEAVKMYLLGQGIDVTDHGAHAMDDDDDYPDYVVPCAQAVAHDLESVGIIFGGSGEGEAMAANRTPGIRATVYYGGSVQILKLSREHNDANVLSLGAFFMTEQEAVDAVAYWLEQAFSRDERHVRRLAKF